MTNLRSSPPMLAERASGRNNNFNLIRFLAAAMVMLSHSYPLTGNSGEPLSRLGLSYGFVAVDAFFVISGFLVTGSLFNRADTLSFIRSRCLRIFPALVVCNLVCIGVVGLLFTRLPLVDYLKQGQLLRYFVNNTLLVLGPLQSWLPGVFMDIPFRYTVNGSLWTLPHELRLYLLATIFSVLAFMRGGLIGPHRARVGIILIGLVAMGGYLSIHTIVCIEVFQVMEWVPLRLLALFFGGGALWILRGRVPLSGRLALLCVAALLVAGVNIRLFFIVYTLTIPYLVLYGAYAPTGRLWCFNRLGDYSYGMYIYAFPVQQSIASLLPGIGVAEMFGLAWLVTLVPAMLSWHLIEQPLLRLK
ncbi:MAG: acyltransferase [Pseudomonadota bacterium]